jgi:hypothetical protein
MLRCRVRNPPVIWDEILCSKDAAIGSTKLLNAYYAAWFWDLLFTTSSALGMDLNMLAKQAQRSSF